ncbi:MAG: type II toxin-antitoxin system HicB family antitoxin [Candidatus Komeilibacteria bacterium]|nr:type II toxin-antitoxin system HicB family antitoxin [Candidatus Komeilibacteria bacterium]
MKNLNFTVYIERDEDGVFIGSIPTIPSCYAQGKTQEEMLNNLQEVLRLCLRNLNGNHFESTKFVGIQNLEISYA